MLFMILRECFQLLLPKNLRKISNIFLKSIDYSSILGMFVDGEVNMVLK